MSVFLETYAGHIAVNNNSDIIKNISDVITVSQKHIFFQNEGERNSDEYSFTTAGYNDISSVNVAFSTESPIVQKVDVSLLQFIVWGILGTILAFLGFLGNILSIIVLHRRQMRSSTSYYLLSLAIYDNVILLGMMTYFCLPALVPYTVFLKNYMSFFFLTMPFGYPLSLSAQMGSIYTCVGFTVERFIAVCRPLHAANTCTKSRTVRAIILILIWSIVYNIPRFFHYHVIYEDIITTNSSLDNLVERNDTFTGNSSLNCHHLDMPIFQCQSNITSNHVISNISDLRREIFWSEISSTSYNSTQWSTESRLSPARKQKIKFDTTDFGSDYTFKHLYLIYFQLFFMFLLPFLLILIMNIGLIRAVRSSQTMHQSMCASARKEHSLTVMLIAVIVVFLVCQFPTIIDNMLIAVIGEDKVKSYYSYMCFYILCTFLVEVNAASNFLLYCFFGKKFRLMLLNILGFKRKKQLVAYRSTVSKSRANGSRTYEVEVSVM